MLFFSTAHSKCTVDLGLVVDKTRSIRRSNIPKLRAALEHLVQRFSISEEGTHVSLGTFARKGKLRNKFNEVAFHSQVAVLDLIERRIDYRLGMPTRLDRGISMATNAMFIEKNGLRESVRKVLVLYTDGRSHPKTETFYLNVVALKVRLLLILLAIAVAVTFIGLSPECNYTVYMSITNEFCHCCFLLQFIFLLLILFITNYFGFFWSSVIHLKCGFM